jgi:hypothetical protein
MNGYKTFTHQTEVCGQTRWNVGATGKDGIVIMRYIHRDYTTLKQAERARKELQKRFDTTNAGKLVLG